jgi:hypothetical protein
VSALLTAIVASVPTFLLTLLATKWNNVRYLISSRGKHKHLNGPWKQYHLSTDSDHGNGPFWVEHDETLKITCFGRVTGKSIGRYRTSLTYGITGAIRDGVMWLTFTNKTAGEIPAMLAYPRLLSAQLLVGTWTGCDFDGQWSTGPIILSRSPLTKRELDMIATRLRILAPSKEELSVRAA